MKTVLLILMALTMAAVLGTLLLGLINLVRPDHDPRRSNTLMRYRVILQFAALVVFAILLGLYRS